MADSGEILAAPQAGIGCSVKPSASIARAAVVASRIGDTNFESDLLGSARHRQAIQQEGPVLVDDIEQSSRWLGVRGCHSLKFPKNSLIAR